MGLFDKIKKKEPQERAEPPKNAIKRYEFTETGEKVLIDDNYRPPSKAKVFAKKIFNEENKARLYAEAKSAKNGLVKGARKLGEAERRYEAREERVMHSKRRYRQQESYSPGFDFITPHPQESYNIQESLLSSRRKGQRQPTASDITSSLLGSTGGGGKRKKKSSKGYDPFDFSGYFE